MMLSGAKEFSFVFDGIVLMSKRQPKLTFNEIWNFVKKYPLAPISGSDGLLYDSLMAQLRAQC